MKRAIFSPGERAPKTGIRLPPLLLALALLAGPLPPRSVSADIYVVKKYDTLSEIAAQHNLSLNLLRQRNHLSDTDKIFEGQKIVIPSRRPALDPGFQRTLEKIKIEPQKWKYIVIHHSGSESGSAKAFDRYHREERHMENGLAYHFVIGNGNGMGDGEIAIGNRWTEQLDGGHLASPSLNEKSIGVCLVGNFDEVHPTKKQLESLESLIEFLLQQCHLKPRAVTTHQRINTIFTRCPGRFFPTHAFLKELRQMAAAKKR